ncbi:MAG: NUDIX hydrolase [Proteobacteria bacterium]|nr:NUDIX hydrolase [Pseudomonadota bacterium]
MNWPPHITVAAIVTRNEHFLMVEEEIAGAAVLNQPAGHLEPGETLIEAMVRETLEETGWQVTPRALLGVYHYDWAGTVYHRIGFIADPLQQVTTTLDPDITACHWLTLAELTARQHRSPIVQLCIDDFIAGQQAPLSFLKHPGSLSPR